MLFIEETSPPPFYQHQLSAEQRTQLDKWFIGHRSQAYYLKRFAQFDEQGYLSAKWNWAAFVATFGWLLYRKRYLDCIVYTIAGWSFIQLNVAIILVAFEFLFMSMVPDALQMLTRFVIAGLIWLFWSVMVARWSDAYYYRMARREIADALADYPQQPEKQKAHLQKEGGVSIVGLAAAFGLFTFLLMVIYRQFLPLYANPIEKSIIQDSFSLTRIATSRVEGLYQQQGACPVGATLDSLGLDSVELDTGGLGTAGTHLDMQVVERTEALGNKQSSCVLITRIQAIPFPNRNLNDQTFIMYRPIETEQQSQWQCVTSLNNKQKPVTCQGD
ncbi:DUF2628 domain-containing protein [Psychrobacter sp. FDAARGOS_221]|uniref:DUF2628 domain-containing protein n=1 Tax=Psychrobacter sp. FDAARGOS_221 TaxID=1975705 RepID=UPI000BB59AAB|nr:DUF2628 domain-containing protein [Psychrobacter sp. FDAARGOS_221]PNK61404.1 DUF2628 domain-containing protein [Psychrobacter sp. FDAARGOS_221]